MTERLRVAVRALLIGRQAVDRTHEEAYHFMFKSDGALLWSEVEAALAQANQGGA